MLFISEIYLSCWSSILYLTVHLRQVFGLYLIDVRHGHIEVVFIHSLTVGIRIYILLHHLPHVYQLTLFIN